MGPRPSVAADHRGPREANAEGLRLLDQALNTDPECASAYAWKGCTLAQAYTRGYIDYSDELEEEVYQIVLNRHTSPLALRGLLYLSLLE